jgi:hypothetical protein
MTIFVGTISLVIIISSAKYTKGITAAIKHVGQPQKRFRDTNSSGEIRKKRQLRPSFVGASVGAE